MTVIWAGLAAGALYALVGVVYNIVFLSTGVFNFAQAQVVMLGAFAGYVVLVKLGLPWPAAMLTGAVGGGLLGAAEEQFAVRPIQGRGLHGELVTTLGVAIMLDGLALLLWGSQPIPVPFMASASAVSLLGGRVLPIELLLIAVAVIVTVGGELISRRTVLGLQSLATAEDRLAALVRGIDVKRLSLGSFVAAGALSGMLGIAIGAKTYAIFNIGDILALKAFVVLAIGGFGSQKGALIAGAIVGLVEAGAARYLGANYQNLTILLLLMFVLLARPTGLFGEPVQRMV